MKAHHTITDVLQYFCKLQEISFEKYRIVCSTLINDIEEDLDGETKMSDLKLEDSQVFYFMVIDKGQNPPLKGEYLPGVKLPIMYEESVHCELTVDPFFTIDMIKDMI